jgi:dTDP-glucose pyrophosphorylase
MLDLRDRTIKTADSLIHALKKMDLLDRKLLIVLDSENQFSGLLSIGDIQRGIINNLSLDSEVSTVLRKNIKIATPDTSFEKVKEMMLEFRMELCPVVHESNTIIKVYFWEDIFEGHQIKPLKNFNLPVVIMAGGLGTRMRPLTNVIPKPLIPIGDKSMLEHIFDRFSVYGCDQFYLSVNYKSSLIKFYIDELNLPHSVHYVKEESPLGTAGSLRLLKNQINGTFFVSNCDILIDQDYSEILDYHRVNGNELTVVAAIKNYSIPYGTIDTGDDGQLLSLNEKPNLTFKINSGMYILESHLLQEIPEGEFFHITQLIERINKRNGKVGVFPVSQKSWKDVGEWDEYITNLNNHS